MRSSSSYMLAARRGDIAAQVHLGADWLNVVHLTWLSDIRIDALDLSSAVSCPLGQLFPSLYVGYAELQKHHIALYGTQEQLDIQQLCTLYGFEIGDKEPNAVAYKQLTDVWRAEITMQRAMTVDTRLVEQALQRRMIAPCL